MNDSAKPVFAKAFSHIYVERGVRNHPRTCRLLAKFPDAVVIECEDYKEIFSRSRQRPDRQKNAQALLLAASKQPALYPGARVCQSFGNEHFYYASNVMNCVFDCEYCYLQGMYPSAHLVVFVNLEDTFAEIDRILKEHPMYISISYDTDLLALESLTGYLAEWCAFAASRPSLLLEVRTKAAASGPLTALPVLPNFIWAFTLSPEIVIKRYEHKTPSLFARLSTASAALSQGRNVRLCFDPLLRIPDFQIHYRELFQKTFAALTPERITDVSLGVFRIGKDYLKNMRKNRPCAVTCYPYQLCDGVYSYEKKHSAQLLAFAKNELLAYLPESKLFLWQAEENKEGDTDAYEL